MKKKYKDNCKAFSIAHKCSKNSIEDTKQKIVISNSMLKLHFCLTFTSIGAHLWGQLSCVGRVRQQKVMLRPIKTQKNLISIYSFNYMVEMTLWKYLTISKSIQLKVCQRGAIYALSQNTKIKKQVDVRS